MDKKIVFTDDEGNEYTQEQMDEAEAKAELQAELTEEDNETE